MTMDKVSLRSSTVKVKEPAPYLFQSADSGRKVQEPVAAEN